MPPEFIPLATRLRSRAYLLSIFACLVFIIEIRPQSPHRAFSEPTGIKAAPNKIYDFEKWKFSIGSYSYEIDNNGRARRLDGRGRSTRFRLDVTSSEHLVRVYYAQYNDDLLLLCEEQSGGEGSGFVSRFDGKTLRRKWRAHIPGFNVANGLIEGNSVYLGAIGFAARLNLDTGKFVWKHDDFYRKYREDGAFNIFETPKIVGNTVVYRENQDMYRRRSNIIRFNKNSGKVIKVELN